MAEYKNGVNYRGNMSVSASDVNSEVQTGRAVFVDEDKYEKDADYKAKVDKCIEEGFHKVTENGSSGGEGSGGTSYPFVIKYARTEGSNIYCDKTWQEVKDAYDAGMPIYYDSPEGRRFYVEYVPSDAPLEVYIFRSNESITLHAASASEYLYIDNK